MERILRVLGKVDCKSFLPDQIWHRVLGIYAIGLGLGMTTIYYLEGLSLMATIGIFTAGTVGVLFLHYSIIDIVDKRGAK